MTRAWTRISADVNRRKREILQSWETADLAGKCICSSNNMSRSNRTPRLCAVEDKCVGKKRDNRFSADYKMLSLMGV